jgi:polyisoprenoid-binding protein YceI
VKIRSLIIGVIALCVMAMVVAFTVLRPTAEATEPIQAIPLAVATEVATEAAVVEPTVEIESEPVPAENSSTGESAETAEETASVDTSAAATTAEPAAAADTTQSAGALLFEISQDSSQVQFELDEDLRGVRTTVIGNTNQVAGQISFDPADLTTAQVGIIQVNARTLVTDNNFRNRAMQNEILDTGSYEYITFTPTAVEGLPESVAVGETVTFTIIGDLTIRDTTRPATFTVTATLVSATKLAGAASTTVLRADYGLQIPNVPHVANVEDEVGLTIEFVANAG